MRYLINWQYYNKDQGPILFYTGNEGNIWSFYNNSGFVTDTLAKKFGAVVVFAEHRFYGKSWPFGTAEKSFTRENVRYLTVPQVMRDYINLINVLKSDINHLELENRAVILNGGSYGGMLSAWMRMYFPNQVQGALAASAPVLWFKGYINPNTWSDIASNVVLEQGGQECFDYYKFGLYDLESVFQDQAKWANLQTVFGTCDVPKSPADVLSLQNAVYGGLQAMVQINYPYATNFEAPLPGWPNKVACDAAKAVPSEEAQAGPGQFNWSNINAIGRAYNIWTSVGKTVDGKVVECVNFDGSAKDSVPSTVPFGWDVQTCNDVPMLLGDDPATSAFGWKTYDKYSWDANCRSQFNLIPQYDWVFKYFGGQNPGADFDASSNIIFSNGKLDPWSGGGVLTNVTDNNIALIVEDGAHHYDLRLPNEADTESVKEVRATEFHYIKKWIEDFQGEIVIDNS